MIIYRLKKGLRLKKKMYVFQFFMKFLNYVEKRSFSIIFKLIYISCKIDVYYL